MRCHTVKAEDYYVLVLAFLIAFIILSLFSSISSAPEKPILTALALFMLALAISLAIAGLIKVYLERGTKAGGGGQATQQ